MPSMGFQGFTSLVLPLFLFSSFLSATSAASTSENFILCLAMNSNTSTPITNILYSPHNSSYSSILEFSVQNLRFNSPTTPKPQFIITPLHESHIQAAVVCSKKHGFLTRVRSGGHDSEGMSYISYKPFVVIDLVNFKQIDVNIEDNTAWVQAGATVGEVYYRIAEKSSTHTFPSGDCTTVGVGGFIGGGGLAFLTRKHGLAADNIVDAYFSDVNGKLLDRKSMGEDLFWAIRGGGGASFGVIIAWKIQLVSIPSTVTVFRVPKTLEQGATSLFFKWQNSAPKSHKDLYMRAAIEAVNVGKSRTIQIRFESLYLGSVIDLLPLMETSFPELGLEAKDCNEMSWINATLDLYGLSGPLNLLLNRSPPKYYFKANSDFVQKAISITELEGIWKVMLEEDISPLMINYPLGGRMDEISESALPFPHRSGNLYMIQYIMPWLDGSESTRYLESARRLYSYMTPYVSKSPRASYFNFKDLDLGINKDAHTSYKEARVWGEKYFKGNFARLAFVKSKVDPENFFWNEQSIPPIGAK